MILLKHLSALFLIIITLITFELLDNGLIDAILTNGSHIQISRRKIKNLKARLGL